MRTKSEFSLLEKLLNEIKSKGSPSKVGNAILQKAKKIHTELGMLKNRISELEIRAKTIKNELANSNNVKITVQKKLYPNVHININDVNVSNNRERGQTVISSKEYEIEFN